jgi:hypothetical protein
MVDKDLILAKAGSVKRHIDRIKAKSDADMAAFMQDLDRQEIIAFNMHLAIQNCMDIAAHIISDEGLGIPGSAGEMFLFCRKMAFYPPILPIEWSRRLDSETYWCTNTKKSTFSVYTRLQKKMSMT